MGNDDLLTTPFQNILKNGGDFSTVCCVRLVSICSTVIRRDVMQLGLLWMSQALLSLLWGAICQECTTGSIVTLLGGQLRFINARKTLTDKPIKFSICPRHFK